MKRRLFLTLAGIAPLAACANRPTTISTAAGDAETLAAALQAIAPQLLVFVADPATKATIQADIALAVQSAASVQAATSGAATPLVAQIIQAVQAIASVVLPIAGIPAATFEVLNAALNLLPTLAAAVGILAVSSAPRKESPAQARVTLKAASHE